MSKMTLINNFDNKIENSNDKKVNYIFNFNYYFNILKLIYIFYFIHR